MGKLQDAESRGPQSGIRTPDAVPIAAGPCMWRAVGGPVRPPAYTVSVTGSVGTFTALPIETNDSPILVLYW